MTHKIRIFEALQKVYDAPFLKRCVIYNLQIHGAIKKQSDNKSFKLTKRGRDILADIGYEFICGRCKNIRNYFMLYNSLEEMGMEYLLIPKNQEGVYEIAIINNWRYKNIVAKLLDSKF